MTFALWVSPGVSQQTQQKPSEAARSGTGFDPAAIRRQAAQLAEFRKLLADPDPSVRLLTMREALRAGDSSQRQLSIEAGLASGESAMIELALRGVMMNIQQIVIEFVDAEGKPTVEGGTASLRLTVGQFNTETGQLSGPSACGNQPKWSGQLQGTVFSFNADNHWCSGTLTWVTESAEFLGRVNIYLGEAQGNRNGVWKPR
jgi:hypothetical protein